MLKKCYPGGLPKALTFSFDDGHCQDIRLIGLFNRYGMKATFNLIGGSCANTPFSVEENGVRLWDGSNALRTCYAGHEVALHGYTHRHMTEISYENCIEEIRKDREALERAFGYPVDGFASPYGEYDERLLTLLKENGVIYHRPTVHDSTYSLPEDFLLWYPGPHFSYYTTPEGKALRDGFLTTDKEMACLYIWGHSFELTIMDCYSQTAWNGVRERWTFVENEILKPLAGKSDIWYATNRQICEYVTALRKATVTERQIVNPTEETLWFANDGVPFAVAPQTTVML